MNNTPEDCTKSRRKQPSAFFAFCRALGKGIAVSLVSFFFELLIAGLFPVWKEAFAYGILWIVPCLLGAGCFLDGLIRKPRAQFMLWLLLLVCVCAVQGWIYLTPSSQLGQIRMLKNQVQSIEEQKSAPLIENVIESSQSEVPFYIETINGQPLLSKENEAEIASYIRLLPEDLQKKAGAVYFLSPKRFYAIEGCLPDPEISGITQLEKAAIFIKDRSSSAGQYQGVLKDGTPVALDSALAYRDTLVHEFMHLLDVQREGSYLQLSSSPDWKELFEKYRTLLGDYGATSPEEFFAEAGVYALLYPDQLQNTAPEIYFWLMENALNPN